jgi:hypothetical protein
MTGDEDTLMVLILVRPVEMNDINMVWSKMPSWQRSLRIILTRSTSTLVSRLPYCRRFRTDEGITASHEFSQTMPSSSTFNLGRACREHEQQSEGCTDCSSGALLRESFPEPSGTAPYKRDCHHEVVNDPDISGIPLHARSVTTP